MQPTCSVVLAGVGGQGTLLAAKVLAEAARVHYAEVKTSEVHGMAQRGGSVITQVRFGEQVFSPLTPPGTVDLLITFEKLEALRAAHLLRTGGMALINEVKLPPMPVIMGKGSYPEDVIERLQSYGLRLRVVNAAALAEKELGYPRVANMVMMGAASAVLEIPLTCWNKALQLSVPEKWVEINQKAFALGRSAMDGEGTD